MIQGRIATLIILVACSGTLLQAQVKSPCSLLTSSEASAFGAKGQGIPSDVPVKSGPAKGETMKMCSWRMATGGIHLAVAKASQGQSHEAFIARVNQTYAALKAQGWKQEEQKFGTTKCVLMTPPAGQQDAPFTTGCFAEAKGMALSISTLSKTRIPMEKLKALMDAAVGRL